MSKDSYLNIREQEYVLGKMTEDQERTLAAKNLVIYENDSRFWSPNLELGRTCFDYVNGDIFTAAEKADYNKKEKIIITNPELIPKLNALEAMQISARKTGVTVAQGPEDAPDVELINRLLINIQQDTNFAQESRQSFLDGMISSFPSWMWFCKSYDWAKNRSIDIFHPAWDSILPEPHFKRTDYFDGNRVTRLCLYDKENLKRDYKHRAKEIEAKIQMPQFEAGTYGSTLYTSAQRDILFNQAKTASQAYDSTGQILVIERNHFVYVDADVWVSPDSEKPEILPEEWTEEEVAKWQQTNPKYEKVNRNVRVLWVTTCTSTGMLLENARHWYQENEFPCEIYIPKMLNNKPHGMVEYLRGPLKGKNVARIEHLHSLRLANDNVIKVKAGSVENARDLPAEIAKSGGIVVINEDADMTDVEFVQNRREQTAWNDASNEFQGDMDRIFMDRNVEGGSQSSQESGKAIKQRIEQGQSKQAPYFDTYDSFDLRCIRKILNMIPYVFTEYFMLRYIKEDNTEATAEFNVPTDFDWTTGAVTKVKNNLAGAKYDYREAHGDNSITGREFELKVFQDVLKNILPSMPDTSLWPSLLLSIPNRLANEFGRKIQKQLDAQAEQGPEAPKMSFSFTGEDLLYNPIAQGILQQSGYQVPQVPPPSGDMSGQVPVQKQTQPSQMANA